jgi:flotillin
MIAEAEAEGNKKKLLAEAEGKRASLMAEADKIQAIEMAPALAVEKMIASGLTPEYVVNYKTVDQLADIANAQSRIYEHINLGQVTVYGNENTAGNFMANTAKNLSPALDILNQLPIANVLSKVFTKSKEIESKPENKTDEFEKVD